MNTNIDHLVIGASTLPQGVNYVREMLGIEIPLGGVHPKMGTHNHLMRLGEQLFLEIIAINPEGMQPDQPRWFGLDDPLIRASLNRQPRLLTWVANTRDIHATVRNGDFNFGRVKEISRGELSWLFGVPDDGRILAGGLLPYLMQWQTESHPARKMHDADCHLESLDLYHANAEWLADILASIGILEKISLHPLPENQTAYLCATIATPTGTKQLSSVAIKSDKEGS